MKRNIIALALGFLIAAGSAFAQPRESGKKMTGMGHFQMMSSKLKLTDEQKSDIQKIKFGVMQKAIDIRAKLAHARLDYEELASADNPDESAISDKIDEMSKLQTDLHKNLLDAWFAVNKILTPDQQKIWKKVLEHPMMARQRIQRGRVLIRNGNERRMMGGMMGGSTGDLSPMPDDGPVFGDQPMSYGSVADLWGFSDEDQGFYDDLSTDYDWLINPTPMFDNYDFSAPTGDRGIEIFKQDDAASPDAGK